MMEVGSLEAKNKLTELLDLVEAGGEVLITRRGRPVARLVPPKPAFDRAAARKAAEAIVKMSRGVTLGGLAIKDLVDEGRRF